jgi:hypothetical protein
VQRRSEEPEGGAYTEISVSDPIVLEAHAFLREELRRSHPDIELGQIEKAERQVVAGQKIRLVCTYRVPPGRAVRELTATVYFDLAGNRSLRSLVLDGER